MVCQIDYRAISYELMLKADHEEAVALRNRTYPEEIVPLELPIELESPQPKNACGFCERSGNVITLKCGHRLCVLCIKSYERGVNE